MGKDRTCLGRDENTKSFHQHVQSRKAQNIIWRIGDEEGAIQTKHGTISRVDISHSRKIFIDPREPNIEDITHMLSKFNTLVIQKHHEVEDPKEFLTSLNKNNTIGPCLAYKII